jgi:hypothetical protein
MTVTPAINCKPIAIPVAIDFALSANIKVTVNGCPVSSHGEFTLKQVDSIWT